ncbi:hypothetical protein ACQ4PT_058344 [Festuca glaucescens]
MITSRTWSAHRSRIFLGIPIDKDLSRNSYRWKIMVRVARIWEFRSSDQSTLFSLEFIVVDQQKSVMEGVIPGNRVDQFKDQLKEGSVYTIDKFDLFDPKKAYRSVDGPFRIGFTMRTLLAEVVAPPENFPMIAHNALPFSVLTNRINSKIVLSDVVGLVTKVTGVMPPSGKATSQKRLVYITDGSDHGIVTLWGEQADLFDADALVEATAQEPIIVLFVGMTVGQYSGLLTFKSTSVTRWYVNAPIPEIAAVHESYITEARVKLNQLYHQSQRYLPSNQMTLWESVIRYLLKSPSSFRKMDGSTLVAQHVGRS